MHQLTHRKGLVYSIRPSLSHLLLYFCLILQRWLMYGAELQPDDVLDSYPAGGGAAPPREDVAAEDLEGLAVGSNSGR